MSRAKKNEVPPMNDESKPVPKEEPKPVPKEEPKPVPKEEPKPVPKEEPKPVPKEEPNPVPKEEPNPVPKEEPKPVPKEEDQNEKRDSNSRFGRHKETKKEHNDPNQEPPSTPTPTPTPSGECSNELNIYKKVVTHLVSFQITMIRVIPLYNIASADIEILTDTGNIYRTVTLSGENYNKWRSNDNFLCEWIKCNIDSIYDPEVPQ